MKKKSFCLLIVLLIIVALGIYFAFLKYGNIQPGISNIIPAQVPAGTDTNVQPQQMPEYDLENPKEQGDDVNGQHLAKIISFQSGKERSVTVDYVALINCSTHPGDECPNDYRIVNDNPKQRTFTLLPTTDVVLQTYKAPGDAELNFNTHVSLQAFIDLYQKNGPEYRPKVMYFWITIKDGLAVGITEQYQP